MLTNNNWAISCVCMCVRWTHTKRSNNVKPQTKSSNFRFRCKLYSACGSLYPLPHTACLMFAFDEFFAHLFSTPYSQLQFYCKFTTLTLAPEHGPPHRHSHPCHHVI